MLERKVLGYIHIRKGPNRVGFVDIFQLFFLSFLFVTYPFVKTRVNVISSPIL